MRLHVLLGLLALGHRARAEATDNPLSAPAPQQSPRAAKIDDKRARYYADKYANHPRAGTSSVVRDPSSVPSAPVPVYAEPEYTQTPSSGLAQPQAQAKDYSPYLVEGHDGGASHRGNDTARFFGLSTTSQDLQLGIQFTVPFLSVPLGSLLGQYTDWSSLLQVNWPSLLALGLVLLGAIVLVPWVAGQLSGQSTGLPNYLNLSNFGRADAGDAADTPSLMARLDDTLQKYDIDSTACMQRGVCTYVREAALSVKEGRAGSNALILDGLASNSYINSWLDGTSIQEATKAGRTGASCGDTYSKCPLTANSVYRALAKYVGNTL